MSSGPAVVLTREAPDNARLAESLRARGIAVREIPCLRTRFLSPSAEQIKALPSAAEGSVLVFTSRRGVEGFFRSKQLCSWFQCLLMRKKSPQVLIAAVGQSTGEALRQRGVMPWIIAEPPRADVLARELVQRLSPETPVVAVRGNLSTGSMAKILRDAQFRFFPLQVYENYEPRIPTVRSFSILAVVVFSPSAARRLLASNPWMKSAPFVVPGTTTERALREMGIEVTLVSRPEPERMVTCLEQVWRRARASGGGNVSLRPGR